MRNPAHRKPKPAPIFGVPFVMIVIGLVCGLVAGAVWSRSQVTGFILFAVAFCAFGAVPYLYRREES